MSHLSLLSFMTEFMARGSIYDFLHKQKFAFKIQTLLKVAVDVAKGVCYLHQNNIIHRDLKTANLLMDEYGVRFVLSLVMVMLHVEATDFLSLTGVLKFGFIF